MNNEKYNRIIDEAYLKYIEYLNDNEIYGVWYDKENFIKKCKEDLKFSQFIGLKIEEYQSLEQVNQSNPVLVGSTTLCPQKVIRVTYKDEIIEFYE